jgi:hypothetical protein
MNRTTALAAALAALLLSLPVADAQAGSTYTSRGQKPIVAEGDSEDAGNDKSDKSDKGDKGDGKAAEFPNATRIEPAKAKPGKLQGKLTKLYDLLEKDKFAQVIEGADEIIADPKATPYERGHAAYVAGYAAIDLGEPDYSKAIKYLTQAIESGQMTNSAHFTLMFQVAQMQLSDEHYAESLAMTDRYLAETRSNDPKGYALRGNALYRLDRFAEAIEALKKATEPGKEPEKAVIDMLTASYFETNQMAEAAKLAEAQAAKRPDDKRAQLDLATIYINSEQPAKAAAVFEKLRAAGKLTDSGDYEQGARILGQIEGREKDAAAFIAEGLDKGVLKPSAQIYGLLGQSYYYAEMMPQAAAAWEKGAPLAKDGELFLNLSKANADLEQYPAAKAAAQQALAKGVKRPGDAWLVIASAERAAGNKPAEIAAYREAAKDPNTRASATKMLKSLGAK